MSGAGGCCVIAFTFPAGRDFGAALPRGLRLAALPGAPAGRGGGLAGGADEGGDVLGGLAGEFGQHGGVGVGGDRDGRQAEGFLDDLHVVPGGQQQGRGAVAQVVQADGRQPGEVGDQLERSVTAAGCSGFPSSSVNSNPLSAQASPAASFSLSCS